MSTAARALRLQVRVSAAEMDALKSNAGEEELGPWLRRLGLEASPGRDDTQRASRAATPQPAPESAPKAHERPGQPARASSRSALPPVPARVCPYTVEEYSLLRGVSKAGARRAIESGTWRELLPEGAA